MPNRMPDIMQKTMPDSMPERTRNICQIECQRQKKCQTDLQKNAKLEGHMTEPMRGYSEYVSSPEAHRKWHKLRLQTNCHMDPVINGRIEFLDFANGQLNLSIAFEIA